MIQREKIIAVIEAEQRLIDGDYVAPLEPLECVSPGHCAIGALLFAAGMPDDEIRTIKGEPEVWSDDDAVARSLRVNYGIERLHADRIINANDEAEDGIESRRIAVIELVHRLADHQTRDPATDAAACVAFGMHDEDEDEDEDDGEF